MAVLEVRAVVAVAVAAPTVEAGIAEIHGRKEQTSWNFDNTKVAVIQTWQDT